MYLKKKKKEEVRSSFCKLLNFDFSLVIFPFDFYWYVFTV